MQRQGGFGVRIVGRALGPLASRPLASKPLASKPLASKPLASKPLASKTRLRPEWASSRSISNPMALFPREEHN
jgi:hypothetical protein